MDKAVKIKAPKEAAIFFERFIAEKRDRKKDIEKKFNEGELHVIK